MLTYAEAMWIAFALAVSSAVHPGPSGHALPPQHGELLARSLDRALERAQTQLERSIVLWVDHTRWEDPWRVRGGAYEVRTTESRWYGAQVAGWLQTVRGHFERTLGAGRPPAAPLEVHVFPDLASYNAFGEEFGEHHSSVFGSFYAEAAPSRPVASYYVDNAILQGMWLTHSAVHQYLQEGFGRPLPTWLAEGLAHYFALWYWDWSWAVDELGRIRESGRSIPLSSLLREPLEQYAADPDARFVQLGMFIAYLLHFRPETASATGADGALEPAPFLDYVRGVLHGADPATGLAELPVSFAEIEAGFAAFEFPK